VQPVGGPDRPEHGQGLGASGELTVQDEEGQPTEVAEHHRVDLTRVQVLSFHRGQAGGTTVDQRGVTVLLQADARLEPAAAAEGVPTRPTIRISTWLILAPVQPARPVHGDTALGLPGNASQLRGRCQRWVRAKGPRDRMISAAT